MELISQTVKNIVKEKTLYKEEDMERFYEALKKVKEIGVDVTESKKFIGVLSDCLGQDYMSERRWLKRVMDRGIHLEFIVNQDKNMGEKKQFIGRISQQLEDEEGFNQKVIKKMIISLMILGEWKESYDDIINWEKGLQSTKNSTYQYEKSFSTKSTHETSDIIPKTLRVSAPVLAKISQVNAKLGGFVSKGDSIMVIKAGTTELKIVAPKNGRITSIAIKGKTVYRGGYDSYYK